MSNNEKLVISQHEREGRYFLFCDLGQNGFDCFEVTEDVYCCVGSGMLVRLYSSFRQKYDNLEVITP